MSVIVREFLDVNSIVCRGRKEDLLSTPLGREVDAIVVFILFEASNTEEMMGPEQ